MSTRSPTIICASSAAAINAESALANINLFREFPKRIIGRLAVAAVRKVCDKGERIFSQGDRGDSLYCVVSGRVRIDVVGITGREILLAEMRPGDCFGEIAAVDALPRTAGATASRRTVLLAIHRRQLLRLLEEEPRLATHLLNLVCERLRSFASLYEDSAFLSSPARLAKRVLSLATHHGRPAAGEIELKISQSDLARFLGISRKAVNRELHNWKAQGWVRIARARLFVRDPDALGRLAAGLNDPGMDR